MDSDNDVVRWIIDTLEGTHHGDDDWTWVIEKRNKHLRSQQQPKEKTTLNNPNPTNTFTFYFMNFPSNWDRLVMKDVFARLAGTDLLASTQPTQPRKGLPHALGTRSKTKQKTFLDIKRCNIRMLSNPSVIVSDSNEVDNVIQVGNEIGFKMNGKECDVARILDDEDHNVDP
ncbi:hypothetical protein Tco_0649553 [Tanacetum coccineum]